MNGLAICAGVGAIELSISRSNPDYRTICYVEKDEYCINVLKARMRDGLLDDAPVWDDLTTFDGKPWAGLVDILSAGFPCRPFSTASRGRQVAPNLWPDVKRIITECEPRTVFLENVCSAPWDKIVGDLSEIGYETRGPLRFCPTTLGADHHRERGWLVAYTNSKGEPLRSFDEEVACIPAIGRSPWREEDLSRVLGMADDAPHRMDRLQAAGNSICSAVAALAWSTLTEGVEL